MTTWGLFLECKIGSTYEHQQICHINRLMRENIIISINTGKHVTKIQHPFMVKKLKILGIYLVKYVDYLYAENYKTLLRFKKIKT